MGFLHQQRILQTACIGIIDGSVVGWPDLKPQDLSWTKCIIAVVTYGNIKRQRLCLRITQYLKGHVVVLGSVQRC